MSWVAVAIGGSALLGYLGSQNAASAQTNAANQATATQQGMYNQTRQDQTPWRNAGGSAVNMLAYLMGLPGYGGRVGGTSSGQPNQAGINLARAMATPQYWTDGGYQFIDTSGLTQPEGGGGDAQNPMGQAGLGGDAWAPNTALGGYGSLASPFSLSKFQADPGYQFRLAEGQKALERSAAAKGMTLSGAQQKALSRYNQDFASIEYGNAYNRYNNDQNTLYNRLAGISGTGQTSANMLANVGMNTANNISANQLGAGNAAAAGWIGGTNALSNGINSAYNAWSSQNQWNSLMNSLNGKG